MASALSLIGLIQLVSLAFCITTSADKFKQVDGVDPDNDLDTKETGWIFQNKVRQLEYLKSKLLSPLSALFTPYYSYAGSYPTYSSSSSFRPSYSYGTNYPEYSSGWSSNSKGAYFQYKFNYAPNNLYQTSGKPSTSYTPERPTTFYETPLYTYYYSKPSVTYDSPNVGIAYKTSAALASSSGQAQFQNSPSNITPVFPKSSYYTIHPHFGLYGPSSPSTSEASNVLPSQPTSYPSLPSQSISIPSSLPSSPPSRQLSYSPIYPYSGSLGFSQIYPESNAFQSNYLPRESIGSSQLYAGSPTGSSAYSSGGSFGSIKIYTGSPTGSSAYPFGSPQLYTASPTGSSAYSSGGSFGSPQLSTASSTGYSAYSSGDSFGSPELSTASPTGSSAYSSGGSFGTSQAYPVSSTDPSASPFYLSFPGTVDIPNKSPPASSLWHVDTAIIPPSSSAQTQHPTTPLPLWPSPGESTPSIKVGQQYLDVPQSYKTAYSGQDIATPQEVVITPSPLSAKNIVVSTLPGPKGKLSDDQPPVTPGYTVSYYPNVFHISNEQYIQKSPETQSISTKQPSSPTPADISGSTSAELSTTSPKEETFPSSRIQPVDRKSSFQPVLTNIYTSNTIDQTRIPVVPQTYIPPYGYIYTYVPQTLSNSNQPPYSFAYRGATGLDGASYVPSNTPYSSIIYPYGRVNQGLLTTGQIVPEIQKTC